jgi:hypothetical protein
MYSRTRIIFASRLGSRAIFLAYGFTEGAFSASSPCSRVTLVSPSEMRMF